MPSDIVSGKMSSDIENVDWSVSTAPLPNVVRFGSSSSQSSQTNGDICRICHCESDPQNPLLTPCYCSGSLKYVHQTCLQQWLTASETNSCELCKFPFIMHTKIKPFNEWRSLDMSGVERRRLFCAVLFHSAAALCVIWSLCVLIERAAEEVKKGMIGWPFWTKLVVVTVGLTGGVVFMYIQCRQYLHLCHRWRARNRILLIQNAPEKMHPPSPVLVVRNQQMHQNNNNNNNNSNSSNNNNNNNNNNSNANSCHNYYHHHHPNHNHSAHHPSSIPRNSNSSITTTTTTNGIHTNFSRPLHGQIIANIEKNPNQCYDRDWTLDDCSQSSFKPCGQSPGSMTPFHDSIHNIYENLQMATTSATPIIISNNTTRKNSTTTDDYCTDSSDQMPNNNNNINDIINSVNNNNNDNNNNNNHYSDNNQNNNTTIDLNLFKVSGQLNDSLFYHKSHILPSSPSTIPAPPPNSAIFIDNKDILNDGGGGGGGGADNPKYKYYHRHSTIFMSPEYNDNLDKFLGKNIRRYSDTKLLQQNDNGNYLPIFNVTQRNNSDERCVINFQLPSSSHHHHNHPQHNHHHHHHHHQLQQLQSHHQPAMQGSDDVNLQSQITDIIFENKCNNSFDPLELNIQEMLQLDIKIQNIDNNNNNNNNSNNRNNNSNSNKNNINNNITRLSLNNVSISSNSNNNNKQFTENRNFFKSLPNLSASSENLLPQK